MGEKKKRKEKKREDGSHGGKQSLNQIKMGPNHSEGTWLPSADQAFLYSTQRERPARERERE